MPLTDWLQKYPRIAAMMQGQDEVLEYTVDVERQAPGVTQGEGGVVPNNALHCQTPEDIEAFRAEWQNAVTQDRDAAEAFSIHTQRVIFLEALIGRIVQEVPFVTHVTVRNDIQRAQTITIDMACGASICQVVPDELRENAAFLQHFIDDLRYQSVRIMGEAMARDWLATKMPDHYTALFQDGVMRSTQVLPLNGTGRPQEHWRMTLPCMQQVVMSPSMPMPDTLEVRYADYVLQRYDPVTRVAWYVRQ